MAKGLNMKAVLSLDSKQFKQGINKIKKQIGGFANFLKGAFAIGSITAFGKQMVQVGADFENAMARVKAVSNATTKEFQAMQAEAQRLGATTKYTATEAANALENLTRNGLTATQATKALEGVLQLAQANAIELANAADILTNTMNAFGLSVNDTQRINDALSSAAANAATNINELYEAMVVAGPYSKIMGKSLEETAAAIGVLANNGIKGSGAGKAIAAMYQRLSAITPKAQKELDKYGITIDEITVKNQSLAETLKQLNQSGIGNSVEALSEIFGKNFAGDISQLINNVDGLDLMLDKIGKSAGTTARMFEQGVGSVQKELDTLKSSYEGLLINISQKTGGVVKSAIRLLQNLIGNFKTVSGTIMNVASVAVPLLSGQVIKLIKNFKAFFTTIKTEGAIATATMGGWITAIATLVTWVGTALVGAWNRANQAMKDARTNVAQMNDEMVSSESETGKLKVKVNELLDALEPEKDKKTLSGIVNELVRLFPQFEGTIRAAAEQAGKTGKWEKFRDILNDIADAAGRIKGIEISDKLKESLGQAAALQLQEKKDETAYKPLNRDLPTIPTENTIVGTIKDYVYKYAGGNKDLGEKYYQETLSYIGGLFGKYGEDYELVGKSLASYLKNYGGGLQFSGPQDKLGEYIGNELKASLTSEGEKYINNISSTIAQELYALKNNYEKSFSNVKFTETYYDGKPEFDEKMKVAVENFRKATDEYREKVSTNRLYADRMGFKTSFGNADNLIKKYDYLFGDRPSKVGNGDEDDKKKNKEEKTDTEQIKELIDAYKKKKEELKNQIAAETAEQSELDDLENSTWKAITAFKDFKKILEELGETELEGEVKKNKGEKQSQQKEKLKEYVLPEREKTNEESTRKITLKKQAGIAITDDERNEQKRIKLNVELNYADEIEKLIDDLQNGIDNKDFSLVKDDAIKQLQSFKEELSKVRDSAKNLQQDLDISEMMADIQKEIDNLSTGTFTTINTLAEASDRIVSSIQSILEVFDEDISESPFFQGFSKFFTVVNGVLQIISGVNNVMELFNNISKGADLAMQKQLLADKAAELGISEGIAVAETQGTAALGARLIAEKALASAALTRAAGEAAANAMLVPYPGNIAALASNTASIASTVAGMKALAVFAEGGIVGGNSYNGDRNLVRVNSGELILNKAQQGNLYNAIANGKLGGGNVEFILRGDKLVGAINNYTAKKRGI